MAYHLGDTIVALASAPGSAARGVVRISGPDCVSGLSNCFTPTDSSLSLQGVMRPQRIAGVFHIQGSSQLTPFEISSEVLLWPGTRSYTREPAAELHTLGSMPLLTTVIEQLMRLGMRQAEPGEFTLRAFLAGRMDLTQAEAVLGVIEAQRGGDLDAALDQLAGGLSQPLHRLREELASALAELEAGLDFVEEDIEFISRHSLRGRLQDAQAVVMATIAQLATRDVSAEAPRVVITGLPNAGKSSLFNALVGRWGAGSSAPAIVSPRPGATRDFVSASLNLRGTHCELIDTAGLTESVGHEIDEAAQRATSHQQGRATVELACLDAAMLTSEALQAKLRGLGGTDLVVLTKVDLVRDSELSSVDRLESRILSCSSVTGAGIEDIAERLRTQLENSESKVGGIMAATSSRCARSLHEAQTALEAAVALVETGGDELIAAEIRAALDALGEVVGAVSSDDILDRVFSQFCIGK